MSKQYGVPGGDNDRPPAEAKQHPKQTNRRVRAAGTIGAGSERESYPRNTMGSGREVCASSTGTMGHGEGACAKHARTIGD